MNQHSPNTAASQKADLQFMAASAVVGVVAAGTNAVARFREAFGDGVRASIQMPDATAVATGADGSTLSGRPITMLVDAAALNPVSLVTMCASIVVASLTWILLLVFVALIAREFGRGAVFSTRTQRLLSAICWTLLAGSVCTYGLDMLTRNGVLALVGDGFGGTGFAWEPYAPAFFGAMAAGAIAIAFRRGAALQRDTEGLV